MDQINVIEVSDVRAAIKACSEASEKRKAADAADEARKRAAMKVFEALLEVKSESQLQSYSPDELRRAARRRIQAGKVKLEGIDVDVFLDQVIQKSWSGRSISWKNEFVAELGESKAAEVMQQAAECFSYKFVEAAGLVPTPSTSAEPPRKPAKGVSAAGQGTVKRAGQVTK